MLRAVVFFKMKMCGHLEARSYADGCKQQSVYAKEDTSSLAVKTESLMLTP